MVGIKGTGMSALALALHALGIKVTGSDSSDSFFLLNSSNYDRASITIAPSFDAKNVPEDANTVIVSTSHRTKNPEIDKAQELGIPVLTYPEIVGIMTRELKTIAICGSHGKTTTTNMLAHVLQTAGLPVLPLAGPTSQQVLNNLLSQKMQSPLAHSRPASAGLRGQGTPSDSFGDHARSSLKPLESIASSDLLFILEADEYENKLEQYSPFGIILTNIELDHPDYFTSEAQYEQVFTDFIKKIPTDGFLIDGRTIPYVVGKHYEFDAQLVTLAAQKLGVSDENITKGIATFEGSPRRMQKVSDHPLIYDDYGHHPTEIKTTIRALKTKYPDKKIIVVFHPHTFTRTKAFLKEFGDSFGDADYTIALEIWGSAREQHGTVSSRDVVAEIVSHNGKADYAATFDDAAGLLKGKLTDDTLLLTIGAGDVWKLHKML